MTGGAEGERRPPALRDANRLEDTVLVRASETVDILLDITNPGLWMAHCDIAEHTESGMIFSFDVAPAEADRIG